MVLLYFKKKASSATMTEEAKTECNNSIRIKPASLIFLWFPKAGFST
jgi:hypothetical protein